MEFDLSILQLQHILKKLNGIEDIDRCVIDLKPLFLKHEGKSATLVYYMALSIDEVLLDEFLNDSTLGSLLSNATPIDPQWFCRIMFGLEMQDYIFEIIEHGPASISHKLLQSFIELFERKSISVDSSISKVFSAVICKIISLITESNQSISAALYLNTRKLLKFMTTYIKSVLESSKIANIHRIGLLVLDFLCQLEKCLSKIFKDECDDLLKKEFYKVDNEYFPVTEVFEKFENFTEVTNFLLEGLEEIVKYISFDAWITWEELKCDDSTIQTMIGNKIYVITEALNLKNHYVSETLKQCLKHFEIKPLSEDEEISRSSIQAVVDKISADDCKSIGKWYGALMKFDEVWSSRSYLQFMLKYMNCSTIPSEPMIRSLDFIIQKTEEEELRKEFLQTLKQLGFLFQRDVLLEICQRQCIDVFFNESSEQDIITTFNKFSSNSNYTELLEEIIVLFLQSPLSVILFVFKFAVTSKENHILCCHVLEQLQCVWKLNCLSKEDNNCEFPFLHDSLIHLFNDDFNEKATQNLACFFNLLTSEFADSFPTLSLLETIVSSLHNELEMEHWKKIQFYLTILKSIDFNAIEGSYVTIMLAFLAQVASRTSWDFESYCKEMVESNRICCEFITELINISTLDSEWLRKMALGIDATTLTHFCDLWLNNGLDFPHRDKFYLKLLIAVRSHSSFSLDSYQTNAESGGPQNLITRLSFHHLKIISVLHRNEWFPLFNNCVTLLENSKLASPYSAAFEVFANAMLMLAIASDSKTYSCLEYCLGNFSDMFHLLLPNLSYFNFKEVYTNFLKPIKQISCPTVKNNCFYLILPILLKSVQNYFDENLLPCDNASLAPFVLELEADWRNEFLNSIQVKV